jgi:hyperosmotically inducible periplasmic protein
MKLSTVPVTQSRNRRGSRAFTMSLAAVLAGLLIAFNQLHAGEADDIIEASARKTYVFTHYLNADVIKIAVKDGAVTLTGTVSEDFHRQLARDTVIALPGVTVVTNDLAIRDKVEEHSDTWIGLKVKGSLAIHSSVRSAHADTSVLNGIVTLKGEAATQVQKDLISDYVNDIDGIKGIKNEMTLATSADTTPTTLAEVIDDASVNAQVRWVLFTHRSTMMLMLSPTTHNGIVTVTGKANNTAEIDLVTRITGDVVGVRSVVNLMTMDINISKQ